MGRFLIIGNTDFENVAVKTVDLIARDEIKGVYLDGYCVNWGESNILPLEGACVYQVDVSGYVGHSIEVLSISKGQASNQYHNVILDDSEHAIGYIGEYRDPSPSTGTYVLNGITRGTIPLNAKYLYLNAKTNNGLDVEFNVYV